MVYSRRMERVTIYHNPACGKSRGALDILRQRAVPCDVVEYLQQPPDRAGLERIVRLLPDPPSALVRKDKRFAGLGLDAAAYTTAEAVIDLLLAHPELMERPVVIRGNRALIARPSEKVLDLLS
jgi:arsenate reductase